jgi:hypothetical protein
MADAAGLNLDAHLPRTGLRDRTLDEFQGTAGFGDLNCSHGGWHGVLLERVTREAYVTFVDAKVGNR